MNRAMERKKSIAGEVSAFGHPGILRWSGVPFLLGALLLSPAALQGGPRTSANYSIATESVDSAGVRAASANYTNDGSGGTLAGNSTAVSPAASVKAGYAGQLYEVTGFSLNAPLAAVHEQTQIQLAGWQVLDDATLLAVPASAVTWSLVAGPISSISATGLASAGSVYQTTPATVEGAYQGRTANFGLSVVNLNPDDYGSYAADGLPDDWQVQYFGLDNPNAAPNADASHTGQTNLFKYVAGLNPIDPASVFTLSIQPVPNQSTQKALVFSPVVAGRTYTVESTPNLSAWSPLTGATESDAGAERTVTDLDASGESKFYRVLISKP